VTITSITSRTILITLVTIKTKAANLLRCPKPVRTWWLHSLAVIGEAFAGIRQRVIDRLRGDPNLDRLVAQGLELGTGTHIARPIYIDQLHPWLITIEDYVTVGPFVSIITHDTSLAQHTGQTRLGRVVLGKRVYVGVGAILLPGTNIGEDSVVGAGAVVHGEVPPGSLVIGNPGKVAPVKSAVAWHRVSATRAPSWPDEGWTVFSGITEERKRAQREALANGGSGYVPAAASPGSPLRTSSPPSGQ
jgi:maltose O-acetyltransferase